MNDQEVFGEEGFSANNYCQKQNQQIRIKWQARQRLTEGSRAS
jgi:hypothetical protein